MPSNEKTKQRVEQRERNRKSQKEIREKKEQERVSEQIGFTLKSLPEPTTKLSDNVLRYPDAASGGGSIDANSDYVLFEIYKYAPPIKGITGSRTDQQPRQRTNTLASNENYFDYKQIKQ